MKLQQEPEPGDGSDFDKQLSQNMNADDLLLAVTPPEKCITTNTKLSTGRTGYWTLVTCVFLTLRSCFTMTRLQEIQSIYLRTTIPLL